jgi:hypothetical protein
MYVLINACVCWSEEVRVLLPSLCAKEIKGMLQEPSCTFCNSHRIR